MAGGTRDINIFRVLEKMNDAWEFIQIRNTLDFSEEELEAYRAEQRRFIFNGEDVRLSLLKEFKEFLFSCEWSDSKIVREIVGYIELGTPLNEIGDLVGLKNSAFRMRMVRMTDTINSLLFDDQTCPKGVYSLTDLGAIKKCLVKIRLVCEPVEVNEEFSLRQLGWFKEHTAGVGDPKVGPENMDKYFKSVLFLALTSRSFTQTLLDEVDPSSLECAFNDIQSDGVNPTKLLFSLLLRRLTSDSVACKEELAIVKREYRDYLKS